MKNFFITIYLVFSVLINAYCQEEPNREKDFNYFIILYTIGEAWDTTKAAHEQDYFAEHSAYLGELRKTKRIDIGGRFDATGMIILRAKNEQEAKKIITEDKAIQNKIFNAEIFPFYPFYRGCVE